MSSELQVALDANENKFSNQMNSVNANLYFCNKNKKKNYP
jgi:hypothetical protein